MNILKNIKGFTTTELMIALGITSVIGLGGAYLLSNVEKNKYKMSTDTSYLAVEKTVESFLTSPRGCAALKDLNVGDDVEFQLGGNDGPVYRKDTVINGVTITGLKLKNFASLDKDSSLGMAQVELLLYKDKAAHGSRRLIPVAVNVENGIVTDCNFSHTKAFTDLMNKACYQAYGMAAGMTCDQVKEALRNAVVESICTDLYGGATPNMQVNTTVGNGRLKFCNLELTHASDDCGSQFARGFKADGKLNCVAGFAAATPVCTAWSAWTPDASTKCIGTTFTQTATCTAGGSGTTSQTGHGSKTVTYSYSPGPPANYCPDVAITKTDNCGSPSTTVYGTKSASDPSCTPGCSSSTNKGWGGGNCGDNIAAGSEGQLVTLTNSKAGYNGSANFKCLSGTWQVQGTPTCSPKPCTNSAIWLTNCGYTPASSVASGTSLTGTNDAPGYTGSASLTCSLGSWNVNGTPTCSAVATTVGGSGGGSSCFIAGTKVTMWDGSQRAIETLMAGEMIRTFNESTGEMGLSPITATLHHKAHETSGQLFTFETEDGRTFTSNDIHPIYLIEDGNYVRAAKLFKRWQAGEALTFFTEDKQQVKVVKITNYVHEEPVYNLHVQGPYDQGLVETDIGHNYFVDGVMVHNNYAAKSVGSGAASD